jgi:ATP-dependent Zn protease
VEFLMNTTIKTVAFWLVSATLLWRVVKSSKSTTPSAPEISYSQFLSQVDDGNVATVRISKRLKNVEIWYADSPEDSGWGWLVNLFAPLLLLAAL